MANTAKTARKAAPKSVSGPRRSRPSPNRARALNTSTALSIGAAVLTAGAAIAGFLARRQIAAWATPAASEGHDVPDLALGAPRDADARAPVDFRPDMDAPMTPADREALRPATGPAPSLVAEAGTMNSQTGAGN